MDVIRSKTLNVMGLRTRVLEEGDAARGDPVVMIQPSPVVLVKVSTVAVQSSGPPSTSSDHAVVPSAVTAKSSANQPRSWNAASVA